MSSTPYEDFNSGRFDSLAGDSSLRLFGRLVWDLMLRDPDERKVAYPQEGDEFYQEPFETDPVPLRRSANNFLVNQLRRSDAKLARISGFSFQNEMFDLVKPAIFLVHGEGTQVEFFKEVGLAEKRLRKGPTYTERTGMVGQKGSFAHDIYMWVYDRADFTVRLDTETGSFDQVLLSQELGAPMGADFMGQSAGTDPPPTITRRPIRRRWRSSDE